MVEDDALANLRRHLALLGAAMVPLMPCIAKSRSHVAWEPARGVWVDVTSYESSADREPELAAELYTNDLLETVDEAWLVAHRDRLRDRQITLLAQLTRSHRARGDLFGAIGYGQRRLRIDPWSEATMRELLDLRRVLGDRAGAVEDYRQFSSRLKAELGIEPSLETAEAYRSVASGEPAARVPSPISVAHNAVDTTISPSPSHYRVIAAVSAFAGPVDAHVFSAVTRRSPKDLDALAASGWLESVTDANDAVLYQPSTRLREFIARNGRLARLIGQARDAHAAHYERIASEFFRRYWDDVNSPLHRAIEHQLPELCAALRHVLGKRETVRAAHFMEHMRPFFLDSGRLVQADELYDELLRQRALLPRDWQMAFWDAKSVLAHRRGLHAQAVANFEAATPVPDGESGPISLSGAVSLMYLGRVQESLLYLQSALKAERSQGENMGLCWTIWALAEVLLSTESDLQMANTLLAESVDVATRHDYRMLLAISQYQQARCSMMLGRPESAMLTIDRALDGFARLHARGKTFSCYAMFVKAQLAFAERRTAAVRAILRTALEFLSVLGDPIWIGRVIELFADAVLADGDLFSAAEFLGSSLSCAPAYLKYPEEDNRRRERLTANLRADLGAIDFATAIGIGSRRSIAEVQNLMVRDFSSKRVDAGTASA